MVTGGVETEVQTSVEVLRGNGTYLCTLVPSLPKKTYFHTQIDGNARVCGGATSDTSAGICQSFESGTWTPAPSLNSDRTSAVSWKRPPTKVGPTIIMGGRQNPTTAEILVNGTFIPFANNLTFPINK